MKFSLPVHVAEKTECHQHRFRLPTATKGQARQVKGVQVKGQVKGQVGQGLSALT